MVDTNGLQAMLSSGRKTAVEIGTAAQARVQVGCRVLWNVGKIQKYLDAISEQEHSMDDLRMLVKYSSTEDYINRYNPFIIKI